MKIKHLQTIYCLLFFFFYTEGVLRAQQEGQQTLFMFNSLAINPAVSGTRDMPTLTLMTRNQWIGFKGAPIHQNLSFHTPFLSKRLGMGMTISNRQIGIFRTQTASMSWAYSPIQTKDFMLRVGLQGSAKRMAFRFDDSDQASTIANERNAQNSMIPRVFGNFGMGVFMSYKGSYIGLSVPFVYANVIGFNTETPTTAFEKPHLYLTGGLNFPLMGKLYWKPSGIVKRVSNAPWGVEVNSSLVYDDKITAGLSYRAGKTNLENNGESLDFLVFYQLNQQMGIGCAYDFNLSPLRKYTAGSVEAVIRYDIKHTKVHLSNPRTFF